VTVRLRDRQEWAFFGALHRAAPAHAVAWWIGLAVRGMLPAAIAVASGWLIAAVTDGEPLTGPLLALSVVFVAAQVVGPLHEAIGSALGDRTATSLNDRLMWATLDPPGVAHLERADLTDDLTMARDFDLGITGPPLSYAMNFIADGFVGLFSGVASAIVLAWYGWWQAIVLVLAWSATHWLLRESAIWRDRRTPEVQRAQRHAEYSYRLAVDPPAAKEVRLFGLAGWVIDRFTAQRRRLYDLQYEATRLRERSVAGCLVIVVGANLLAFWSLADRAADGRLDLAAAIVALQAAIGVSAIAFGGLNWALDGAAAPVAAVVRLESVMPPAGALPIGHGAMRVPGGAGPEVRFHHVSFGYPGGPLVLDGFDLTIPAGSSLAIVGQNGAGKTTLAKLLCRLYDPLDGRVEVDGTDLRQIDLEAWRADVTAVFQDFVRFELPLRDNVAPGGGRGRPRRAAGRRCRRPRGPRHDPRQGVSGWHRPVGRAVAARRPGPGAVRGARWRGCRAARRADGPARRARRGGDLRAHPPRHARLHHDPHLPPLLDGAPRRSDLRARTGRRRRAGDPRRADGGRGALPHDVRPPGVTVRGARRARGGGRP